MKQIFLILFLSFSMGLASTFSIDHNPQLIRTWNENGYDFLQYPGTELFNELGNMPGAPQVPFYIYRVVLPVGKTVNDFSVGDVNIMPLQGTFSLAPQQRAWSEFAQNSKFSPDPEFYQLSQPFPQKFVRFLGVQHFNGIPIAHFAVYPFQYVPQTGTVQFIQHFELNINFKNAEESGVQPLLPQDATRVSKLLPSTGQPTIAGTFPLPESTDQIDPQLLSSGQIDRYVIITVRELVDALRPLAEWKTQRGVPTVIRTLDEIKQNFPEGVDDAERIRNFIRWSYQKRGTRYVLLAGDTELIPTRVIHTGDFTFAADYYFADLDGTWNADQDDTFGEARDKLQGYPEVYVARIPVLTSDEVNVFLKKLFKYEKLSNVQNLDYPTNVLYIAADLQRTDDSKNQLILKHIDPMINGQFKRTMISQSKEIKNSTEVPLRELNKGYNLIFSEGHGLYFTFRPGARGSDLYNYHLNELINNDPGIWYMASCYTNDILKRCFGEDYILSPTGGGVAYIGNSSWEYPFSGIYLEKEFFNLAFKKGYYHLSEAHYLSRLPYLGYLNFEGPSRIIVYSTLVLGDPEMPIWTGKVHNFDVQQQLISEKNARYFEVVLHNDSTQGEVKNATVVLYKPGAVYQIQRTDETGTARFNITGINLDSVRLTITKQNFKPFESIVNFSQSSMISAELMASRFAEIKGNQNNLCEPNETFALYLKWKNKGPLTWPKGTKLKLANNSALFTFNDTLQMLTRAVAPGDSMLFGPFTLKISPAIESDTTLTVHSTLIFPDSAQITKLTLFNVYTPQLSVFQQQRETLIGDSTSGSPYYTVLTFSLMNEGTGKAVNITAQLISNDPEAQVVSNELHLAELSPGQMATFDEDFVIEHQQEIESVELTLRLSDYSGIVREIPINFTAPTPPNQLTYRTAETGGILLSWPPSPEKDVAGYHVYRSESPEGPFERITFAPLPNAGYFLDNDVNLDLQYYYTLRAVDHSGNFSAATDTILTWSALPFQNGFPVRPSVKAIGSEISGVTPFDFNNDGKKELIVSGSNGQLHVFDWTGRLLFKAQGLEGDLTFPAVGNILGSSQKEIVVASFKEGRPENNIYVIDSETGTVLEQVDLQYNAPSPVVLADLDGDGYDEIMALTHANNAPQDPKNSRLFIFTDSSGVLVGFKDWPYEGFAFEDRASLGNVAVADIDNSGKLSVLVPTQKEKLYCFKPDSSNQPAWIRTFPSGWLEAPLSVADVNNDGFLEIVAPMVRIDKLYLLDHLGNPLPGWENGQPCNVTDPYGHSSPAMIGNVDDDPQLEIIYVGRDAIHVFKVNGESLPGWPKSIYNGDGYFTSNREELSPYNAPVMADVNQDGVQDILYLDVRGYIHAFDVQKGKEVQGFPLFVKNGMIKGQSPVVDDIDGDGDLEVLTVNHEGVLLIWDAPQKIDGSTVLYWNQPLANPQHTSVMDSVRLNVVSAIEKTGNNLPEAYFLNPNYPNPFNPRTTIEFGLKQNAFVELSIFNILGQRVAQLLTNQSLGAGTHKITWNGRNDQGLELASGLYFYRLVVRNGENGNILFTQIRKMIKIK